MTTTAVRNPAYRERIPDDGEIRCPRDLTPRQREVAALVGEGLMQKEICARLHISPGTVKNHLTEIYRTTGLQGQTALAGWIRADAVTHDLGERIASTVYKQPPLFVRGKRFVHAQGVIEALRRVLEARA